MGADEVDDGELGSDDMNWVNGGRVRFGVDCPLPPVNPVEASLRRLDGPLWREGSRLLVDR